MLQIMKILNFIKIVLYLVVVSLFFVSCEKPTKKEVISGQDLIFQTIFSKSCNEGSVEVRKRTQTTVSSSTSTSIDLSVSSVPPSSPLHEKFTNLKLGDKVNIKGKIHDGSPCYQGRTSFTCEARLALGTNRVFTCESGKVGRQSLLGGDVHVFANGTKTYVRLLTGSSSPLVPQASCVISFSCL